MAQGPRTLSKPDPELASRPELDTEGPGKQFPGSAVGVAAPRLPRALGNGGVSALPEALGARASPGRRVARAARGRCAGAGQAPPGPRLLCCARSALSRSCELLPSPAAAARGRGPTARLQRRASWHLRTFFHKGRAAEKTVSVRPEEEEGDLKMPLSAPSEGEPGESAPSRPPKKHTPFHIWRPKKKQQLPPSNCGVFVPHPPQAPLGEARALEAVDESHVATEVQDSASQCGESQPWETNSDGPISSFTEFGIFKKSRAPPPEENKRKPVLGKLGNLFNAGRRRNTRNGLECPASANAKSVSPKDVTASKLPEKESEKSKTQGSQPKQTDACEPGSPQKPQDQPSESCFQEPVGHTELSPGSCSPAAAAGPQCHESDSPQLEPVQAEGETFPDATTAAKQLHSSLGNNSRQEKEEAPAGGPGEDASPGAGREQDTAQGSSGVPGSPTRERRAREAVEAADGDPRVGSAGGSQEHPDALGQPPEAGSGPPGDPPALGAEDAALARAGPPGGECAPGERSHPAKVLTLDIYLRKTEAAPVDEPVDATAGEGECSDPEDMEKRSSGRRSGRRRKSQKSAESPGADAAPPDSAARDDAVFDDGEVVAPNAAPENGSAEKKVKSLRAATDGGVVAAASSPEPCKPGPGAKAQLRGAGEAERSKSTPQTPASSPTKRRARSRVPEAVPPSPVGGPRAPAKESTPKKAPAPEAGPAVKAAAGDSGDEAARIIPRELTVKSSSQLPEFKSEHKRGPLPNHFDGRGEGSRSKEPGRSVGGSEGSDSSLKARNHFGAGRSTVTTKVTLPAKPKNVELNLKTPKNLDSLGNEHNSFSQPVHKGNTATKISLFENKRVNGSPKHTEPRGPRNLPPSSKTFVGRAKLNFAKKAKEMEQPEKKVTPNSHQNGIPGKEAVTEPKATLPKEVSEAVTRDQAVGAPLHPPKAEASSDITCPPEPGAIAQVKVQDQLCAGEVTPEAADCKTLAENLNETAHDGLLGLDTHVTAPAVTPKPQGSGSDSAPVAESSPGPCVARLAPHQMDGPQGVCAPVPGSSVPGSTLKVSANSNSYVLPETPVCPGEETPGRLPGGREASPSRVLVQVRSFVLPVESPQEVSAHIITDSSEVRERQLPSCHSNELEVVSVASCVPQKEEVSNRSSPPEGISCKEEYGARAGPQVMQLKASEKSLPLQAQSQGDTMPPLAKSTGSSNHLESPPRPAQNSVNGQDSPARVLNVSAGSDDSVLDSSSDMEKFTEIIKKMDSAVCVPQKKKKSRVPNSPVPPFAMPPIHEDNLEKVFDPNVFTFGLGKKKENQTEMSPALHLMQNLDTKSKLRSKRTSAEQSVLFKSLHTYANGKDEPLTPAEIGDKENRDVPNGSVKRSRLEKSALFSSLLSSLPQDRIFAPSVTSVSTMTTSFSTSQNTSLSRSSVSQPAAEGAPPCSSDKQPNLPPGSNALKVFNFDSSNAAHSGLKSPSYMEKYLQREENKKELDARSSLHLPETKFSEFLKLKNSDDTDKTNQAEGVLKSNLPNYMNSDTDFVGLFKSSRFDPSLSFSGMSLSETATLRGNVQNKINPRPGKVVIFREPEVSEECIEVFGDNQDCSSWSLSPVILIKVVRGCWILYEKPNFEGHSIPLEEGELELSGLWGIEDNLENNEETESAKPVVIGSIRHVVQDYRISQIDLFTEPEGLGIQNSYFDDAEEIQGFGVMQKTCSIKVHWGTWLIYEGPGYQGVPFILEPGEYPDLSFWDTEEAYIGSMRPLKMGGRKVEFPTDPKVIIYEKPFFEGKCVELEKEMCSFVEGGEAEGASGDGPLPFTAVGSMKVLRGIWVAYEKPGFTGHQYLLEEGEYKDWKDWGGYSEELQSLRPILGDFSNAHMIMYSEKNFGSKGSSIDVLGIVANLKETGYGVKTQSINVLSGVWVAYENPDFTGEQYVLDKGFYTSFEDWGGKNCKISSVQPISLDSFSGPRRRNQIHLFSEPQFQGSSQSFEETTSQIGDSFSAKSCRVLGGSWVAYDGENFSGNQYVLEEGHYPSLSAMGCLPGATFKSLRFIDAEFSEPTIILFEREDFKGKKIELNAETVNLRSLGFNTQIRSVQVIGGIWVTYEYGNYRGRQILLSPAEVPNWYEFSGCRQIGSLRPFIQKRIYFRLRNKATGLFMSTNGNLEDLKLLRIQVMEDVGADDQIWIYQEGCIKCRIAEDCCLTIVGSLVTSGSKLGLALDQNADSQFWSMKSDGRIYSKMKPNLVLDIKGGSQYDQSHIILNTVNQEKITQVWEAMVL